MTPWWLSVCVFGEGSCAFALCASEKPQGRLAQNGKIWLIWARQQKTTSTSAFCCSLLRQEERTKERERAKGKEDEHATPQHTTTNHTSQRHKPARQGGLKSHSQQAQHVQASKQRIAQTRACLSSSVLPPGWPTRPLPARLRGPRHSSGLHRCLTSTCRTSPAKVCVPRRSSSRAKPLATFPQRQIRSLVRCEHSAKASSATSRRTTRSSRRRAAVWRRRNASASNGVNLDSIWGGGGGGVVGTEYFFGMTTWRFA